MASADAEAARSYHEQTKHSYWSVRSGGHILDWEDQPLPFKIYRGLEPLPLPEPFDPAGMPALRALSAPPVAPGGRAVPDLDSLARVLYFSAGITKRRRHPGGEIYFRAASCTGALYHIELYLVCGELSGLEAGVYHFGVHDLALRSLRQGEFRADLLQATAGETFLAHAPAILVATTTFWRNAWKYRDRAYRHAFWDGGTLLANLLAMARLEGLPSRLVLGFIDAQVNRLLGLDEEREAALYLVGLGHDPRARPGPSVGVTALDLETVPLSRSEVDYPLIRSTHRATCLEGQDEVRAWRRASAELTPGPPEGERILIETGVPDGPSLEETILRRGSSRRFRPDPVRLDELGPALQSASGPLEADFLPSPAASLVQARLIVNAVEGLPAGAYAYHPSVRVLERLKEGDFRHRAGFLALEQSLAAQAAVNVYHLADMEAVLQALGGRGYRAAQLEGGLRGGRLYLAAYALGLGATGLTFYDNEVAEFFSRRGRGKAVLFLTALGRPAGGGRLEHVRRVEA